MNVEAVSQVRHFAQLTRTPKEVSKPTPVPEPTQSESDPENTALTEAAEISPPIATLEPTETAPDPQSTTLAEATGTSEPTQLAPDPENTALAEATGTSEPTTEGEKTTGRANGVLRLLESGHFKGVADVRLRINFHEQLSPQAAAADPAEGKGVAYEKFLSIYDKLRGEDRASGDLNETA